MADQELPTWKDVERAALYDPILHRAVTLARQGVPREQALISAALALSDSNAKLIKDLSGAVALLPAGSKWQRDR